VRLEQIEAAVVRCERCPRLRTYATRIARERKRAHRDCEYWGKPVPSFGDPKARVMIVGLAPGAHGSNRTGRPFTGDASGNFLYPALYRAGFASQPNATERDDGLTLDDCLITAAVRCAPPQNKPTPKEIANCAVFLDREMAVLKKVQVVVALGRIGFDAYLNYLKRRGLPVSKADIVFSHAAHYAVPDGRTLMCSYHPSQQNTQTGKLTEKMFTDVFLKARKLLKES
jgi:uracil-DNA glycosylase